ncbi:hypothetical protein HPB47_004763 [Ixodes persulcatus]|uniref:Uncharacterized protein n=1 Tax=Ixodes persulcatus TaxID=34615 RepID=A0AC60PEV2_IXOPE|nr:hypothetical protein HPB47_004763 [Ixodes persulcatus]
MQRRTAAAMDGSCSGRAASDFFSTAAPFVLQNVVLRWSDLGTHARSRFGTETSRGPRHREQSPDQNGVCPCCVPLVERPAAAMVRCADQVVRSPLRWTTWLPAHCGPPNDTAAFLEWMVGLLGAKLLRG